MRSSLKFCRIMGILLLHFMIKRDSFTMAVKDLGSGLTLEKPQTDRVSNVAWAMNRKALLYVVTDHYRRPYK